jgi:hypothetical protein
MFNTLNIVVKKLFLRRSSSPTEPQLTDGTGFRLLATVIPATTVVLYCTVLYCTVLYFVLFWKSSTVDV